MKVPVYETFPGSLQGLLNTRRFIYADLYTFFLVNGDSLHYTTFDIDVEYPGAPVYGAHSVKFDDPDSRALGSWKVGLDASTWQVNIYPRQIDGGIDTIGDIPWLQAATGGAFDGARLYVDRAYFGAIPAYPPIVMNPVGVYRIFHGVVGAIDVLRGGISMNANSAVDLLSTQMPRNMFQILCTHTLFDPGCQLDANAFMQSGVTYAGNAGAVIPLHTTPSGDRSFRLGRILITSGQNIGLQRTIKDWSADAIRVLIPFYFSIPTGTTYNIWPGCSKTEQSCNLYSNRINYGGTPHVPQPENSI